MHRRHARVLFRFRLHELERLANRMHQQRSENEARRTLEASKQKIELFTHEKRGMDGMVGNYHRLVGQQGCMLFRLTQVPFSVNR